MFKAAHLFFFLIVAFPVLGQEASTELSKGLVAEDRGDLIEAQRRFLLVLEAGLTEVPPVVDSVAAYRIYKLSARLDFSMSTGFGFKEGLVFLEAAASQGYPPAQFSLGSLIAQAYVKKPEEILVRAFAGRFDSRDAHNLITAAAEADYYPALMELAEHYRHGSFGALQDPSYAAELEGKGIALALAAVDSGDPEAAVDVAMYIRMGRGLEKSDEAQQEMENKATLLFEARALAGSVEAKRTLMFRYVKGLSNISELEARAKAEYWAKGYLEGSKSFSAVTWVASLYADRKIGKDPIVVAHALYNFATTLDDSTEYAATTRDELGKTMTHTELDLARRLARSCVEDGMKGCLSQFP